MTCRAIRPGFNVVHIHEFPPIFESVAFGGPSQFGDQALIANIRFRRIMTIHTPGHAKGFDLPHDIHLVNTAMAADAAYALIHVGAVVEVDVIRQLVYSNPRDGFAGCVEFPQLDDFRRILFDLGMAVQTGFGSRDSGEFAFINEVVTVTAIDSQLSGMKLVAVVDGLTGLIADLKVLGGAPVPKDENCSADQ